MLVRTWWMRKLTRRFTLRGIEAHPETRKVLYTNNGLDESIVASSTSLFDLYPVAAGGHTASIPGALRTTYLYCYDRDREGKMPRSRGKGTIALLLWCILVVWY